MISPNSQPLDCSLTRTLVGIPLPLFAVGRNDPLSEESQIGHGRARGTRQHTASEISLALEIANLDVSLFGWEE
jgi:hypothetical protein